MNRRGEKPRHVGEPQPGYFLLRLIKGGPLVPSRICHSLEDGWWAEINGERFPAHPDPSHARGVFQIWHGGQEITAEIYEHRLKLKAWAEKHRPDHPSAKPRQRIDRTKTPIII